MKRKASEFAEWFTAQYGLEPSPTFSLANLEEQLTSAAARHSMARRTMEVKARWLDQRDAALKAWQAARDGSKGA